MKKAAAEINSVVSPNETLYAVDPEYQPVFFYVKAPLEYVSDVQELPADAHYFLVQSDKEAEATNTPRWGRDVRICVLVCGIIANASCFCSKLPLK